MQNYAQKNLSNSGVEVLEPADESAWAPGGGARLRRERLRQNAGQIWEAYWPTPKAQNYFRTFIQIKGGRQKEEPSSQ